MAQVPQAFSLVRLYSRQPPAPVAPVPLFLDLRNCTILVAASDSFWKYSFAENNYKSRSVFANLSIPVSL